MSESEPMYDAPTCLEIFTLVDGGLLILSVFKIQSNNLINRAHEIRLSMKIGDVLMNLLSLILHKNR